MADIIITKEAAIKRLRDKIDEAKSLQARVFDGITQQAFQVVLNGYDVWHTSSAQTLRQIFSDVQIAKDFDDDDDSLPIEKSMDEKIDNLKNEINDDVQRIQHIIDDLNNGIYTQIGVKEKKGLMIGLWQAIIVALITTAGAVATAYVAIPKSSSSSQGIGLDTLTLEGKWKYICTSFDGSYQHGGRFFVQKEKDGTLILNGERMWRDEKDSLGSWHDMDFEESDYLQWHSSWIFVRNSAEICFEYIIPTGKDDIIGYCKGVLNSQNGKIVFVKGNFYVLKPPILNGQIIFKRVTDEEYNSKSTLPKNHK